MMSKTQIPRINFSDLINYKKQTLQILKEALMNHGFFIIYNHGIDKKVFENAYQTSEQFFKLDQEVKNKYAFPKFAGARGYTPFGKETALGEKIPDLKEFWHHGPSVDDNYDKRVKPISSTKRGGILSFKWHFEIYNTLHNIYYQHKVIFHDYYQ